MKVCGCDRQPFEDAMPLYEYRCQVCGELEEKIQSYSAPTEHDCPKCGSKEGMTRQISRVAFNMSGGGWYAQGYSDKGAPGKDSPGKDSPGKEAPPVGKESAPSTPSTEGGCCGGGCACKPGA
jgi:putative FmdB family regulatory protein